MDGVNIFDSTLSLSGVAFLTEASRDLAAYLGLRVQTSDKTDIEWDFDYDTGAKKFTADNVFFDMHEGKSFAGLSYARLNAPGRFYTEGVTSAVSDFSQLRVLLGYGSPTKARSRIAANAGFDLRLVSMQYAALQTSYNWDCCGLSIEYRKFELGRCEMRVPTASISRWPTSERQATCAVPSGSFENLSRNWLLSLFVLRRHPERSEGPLYFVVVVPYSETGR